MEQAQAMIFVNKKDEGEKLQKYLKKNNIDAKILTSDLE
jgi:superfamily II DNA/RNA helicase